jgi:kynurenine formamidase
MPCYRKVRAIHSRRLLAGRLLPLTWLLGCGSTPSHRVTVPQALDLPEGVERVVFKTDNTAKQRMKQTAFDPSYTALTTDGAAWVAAHPSIKLVAIDYLSIARYEEAAEAHRALFRRRVIAVEGLMLEGVSPGWYTLVCAPINLAGSDGAPARCLLVTGDDEGVRFGSTALGKSDYNKEEL